MKWRTRLAEILARMAAIKGEVNEVEAIETPTDEDATRAEALLTEWDTLEAERVDVQAKVDQLDRIAAAATDPANVDPVIAPPNVVVRNDPFEGVDDLTHVARAGAGFRLSGQAVDAARSAFDNKDVARGLSDAERERIDEIVETVPGGAEYALVHANPAYRSAFRKWFGAGGSMNADFDDDERQAMREAAAMRTALNITTGSSGQFSLPTVFDPTLIKTGLAAINPIRQLARKETGTQNVWNGVSSGNVTTYWHAEAAALTDGAPTLAHPMVTAGHLTAWVPASWEFFDDSPMVAQLPGLIGEAFDFAESTAFVSGSGTSQPVGVVTAISATAGSTVTATTRGAFTSASSADVFAVVNALPGRYENTSSWVGNKRTFNVIRQMSAAGYGSLFWGNLADGVTPQQPYPLLGSQTYNASDMATTTTTGTVLLVLGDFSQYLVYDVLGVQVEVVQNVVNSSGIPTGQRGIVARKRVGGNVTDANAFRFLLT